MGEGAQPRGVSLRSIFEYDNYRSFLADYVAWQRSSNHRFSLRFLALKAGFSSHSFLDNVIRGKRNLTLESLRKVAKYLRLGRRETAFFQHLLLYNQAKTYQEREESLREMGKIRKSIEFYRVQEDQYAYYAQWYLPVLRELAVYSDWKGDFKKLAEQVRPAISTDQAKQGIRTLIEIGLLRLDKAGAYAQTDRVVTAEDVPGYIFREVRTQYLLRAIEAAESLPAHQRHVAYSVLAMSRRTYEEITRMLDEERKKALVMASEDSEVDGVYGLSMQVFPLSSGLRPDGTGARDGR